MKKKIYQFQFALVYFFLTACTSSFVKNQQASDKFKNTEFESKVLIKSVVTDSTNKLDTEKAQLNESTSLKTSSVDIKNNQDNESKMNLTGSIETPVVSSLHASSEKQNTVSSVLVLNTNKNLKSKIKQKKATEKKSNQEKSTTADTIETAEKGVVETAEISSNAKDLKHLPEIEDSEGFANSRRPIIDPFRVGEKVIHTVTYFGTPAGYITLSVGPFLEVNGRKSYNFITEIKSSRLFSNFYSVEDKVEAYVDYVDLVPHVFKLQIKETAQVKKAESFFDHKKLKANYWENKFTEKNGHEEKKQEWDILPYSQNAFSAIFYMRLFKWNVGQEYSFRVSDDEKNIIFKAKALEKVLLKTDAGEFNAIKIKADVVSRGALSQTGDLFFWLSDDEHRYVLRIEAKIKIGTLVSEVTEIVKD